MLNRIFYLFFNINLEFFVYNVLEEVLEFRNLSFNFIFFVFNYFIFNIMIFFL